MQGPRSQTQDDTFDINDYVTVKPPPFPLAPQVRSSVDKSEIRPRNRMRAPR